MKKIQTSLVVFLFGVFSGAFSQSAETLSIVGTPGKNASQLTGAQSCQQLIVMGSRDLTREVKFQTVPAGIVKIDKNGFATPLANGETTVSVTHGGQSAKLKLVVSHFDQEKQISFPNDVLPIITRNHCNAGACHAKTESQNGFTLSLFGYDPRADYETLVKHSHGRRVSVTSPEISLILQKASGGIPHSGGARLTPDSDDYQTLRKWIEQGARYAPENDPKIDRIEIFPKAVVAAPGGTQQLSVTAFLSDGTVRDITRITQFEPNQIDMATCGEDGLVTLGEKPGSTSVMVRFQEHVDVFRATIPVNNDRPQQPAPVNYIDEEIFKQLSLLGIPASDLSADDQFVRRVTLDIAGRLPTVDETLAFIASTNPEKRKETIDYLLQSTNYADFFAGKWAGILRNKANPNSDWVSRETFAFHGWIRDSLITNKPFNQLAHELITASGKISDAPAVAWYRAVTDPKERMQDIAQVFLGIRMQCAQCHHHPYEKWSQNDYFGFTAFFSTITRKEVHKMPEDDLIYHNRKPAVYLNPASKVNMKPAVPGGTPLEVAPEVDPRHELASWVTSSENPYFAKVVVNRYWKHFFGSGLVEPEDDIRPTNPATHPELLDRLAREFVASDFDIKNLVRTICNSRSYQLSSEPKGVNIDDTQNYARYYPKRMQAEVLLDAFNDLSGSTNSFNKQPDGVRAIGLPDDTSNNESPFLVMFGRPQMDTACECERNPEANLGQSLHLINSDVIQTKLGGGTGRAMQYANEKVKSPDEMIRDLYLAAYSREPRPGEIDVADAHLRKKLAASAADPKTLPEINAKRAAFEDLIWVVANTKEFMFNH